MNFKEILQQLIVLISALAICNCQDEELSLESARASLPYQMYHHAVIYDLEDSIYIFGGISFAVRTEVQRYDVTTDTLHQVGRLPGYGYFGSSVVDEGDGNFLHLTGYGRHITGDIVRYNSTSQTSAIVAVLPESSSRGYGAALRGNATSEKIYLFGGMGNSTGIERSVTCFYLETLEECGTTSLQVGVQRVAAFAHENHAYVFGMVSPTANFSRIEKINLMTMTSELGPPNLPKIEEWTTMVFDGTYAYVIGAYFGTEEMPSNGIIRIDLETFEPTFLPVRNFPTDGTSWLISRTVFVEKLNRIYLIGGYSSGRHGDIWYIQLGQTPA